MRISIHSGTVLHGSSGAVIAEVDRAERAGLAGYWAPMLDGLDTLTVLALASAQVPTIQLGTAVVPIPLRSPYALAQQARTVQEASGGRLVLGLGTGHAAMARDVFATAWPPPLATMSTYLQALIPHLEEAGQPGRSASGERTPVVVGAVNPKMVELAVAHGDGVITWAAGPKTITEVVMPAIARRRDSSPFRVVMALPLCVTDDIDAARAAVHRRLGGNDSLPSYQQVLAREHVSGVAELALVGDERALADTLTELARIGVTEFAAHIVAKGADEDRTWDFLLQQASRFMGAVA